ncbi:septum formation inhibitor Maf [Shewanella sp. Scap07]|uniref:Maf family protein n=1 Tax=Shewanella sp. Scap07 TaxID=2589987 RepID=UPI0015B9836C|nr:Maf family protein [Shewanella sp. Scap07]QLE87073.1 septum formation inhibitor Maf [Shewanella sp. Scap07]
MSLVLASASPRRRELLQQLSFLNQDFSFTSLAADIDETLQAGEGAAAFVARLAQEKALAGYELTAQESAVVIGSDTIVVLADEVLGKPKDSEDAKRMLASLSGKQHQVMTAVAVTDGKQTQHVVVTTLVTFSQLSSADVAAYVATKEPMDKAGAYGIQGLGGSFVARIEGSYSAVVGLPLVETRQLLAEFAIL